MPEDDTYDQNISPFFIGLCSYAVVKTAIYNCCFTWLFNCKIVLTEKLLPTVIKPIRIIGCEM